MKRITTCLVSVLLLVSVFANIAFDSNVVNAQSAFVATYSTNLPAIDGSLTDPEWNDANWYDISLSGTVPATVYFKHDGTNIYIGLKVSASDHSLDQFVFFFDEGDDGGYGSGTCDGVLTYNQEDFKACFSPAISGYTIDDGCYKYGHAGAAWYGYWGGDFSAECGFDTDHWEVEFSIPFTGNDGGTDDVSDLVCTMEDTIGVKIQYFTQPGAHNYFYPAGDQYQIETYATLSFEPALVLSAWASRTPIVDGYIRPELRICFGLPPYCTIIPGEWDDAATVDFTLSYNGEVHDATLYVKNDYINLYLAVKVRDEDYNDADAIRFEFDNDNDGVRELGDNVFFLRGDSFFDDSYIYNAAAGWAQGDDADGGTIDGVGAAYFTAGGDYQFEIAFPLNTLDNAHDFSLSIGSTVGFKVKFTDHGVGSDTWPSPLWSEMADIRIAAPPTPPPSSAANLRITEIEVTQAIQFLNNSLPLVRGKTTVVRVYVSIGLVTGPISVRVYLYGISGGKILGGLAQYFDAPRTPDRGTRTHTANFILPMDWVERSSLDLRAFVKATSSSQAETNYNNNWMPEQTFTFQQTEVPTIYIVPVNTGTRTSPNIVSDTEIASQELYLETVYPVADVNFVLLSWEVLGENAPGISRKSELKALLTDIGQDPPYNLACGGIDQIYGFLPSGGGSSNPIWGGGCGIAACGYRGTSREGTMAHEICHNLGPNTWGRHTPYGCGATGPDANWPYLNDDIQEYGVDTSVSPIRIVDATTPDFMSYCQSPVLPTKWISPYRWENMFNRLLPASASQSTSMGTIEEIGQSLKISGWVSTEGKGHLNPIFRIPGEKETVLEPGNYSIHLQDKYGKDLLVKKFRPEFVDVEGEVQDPYHFAILMPYVEGTTCVLLKVYTTTVLDKICMSANAPTVQVLSPNGGEVWKDLQTISWEANDDDGDILTYRVYYSPDCGKTWTPLSLNIKDKFYQVDTRLISGSKTAHIRVVASDGLNIGEDESDELFTVATKPPTATIVHPEDESQFSMDDTILLRGIGTDTEDVVLPEEAYSWTSDIDGFLGNGSIITTMLQPGVHEITLTVTDSDGHKDTDKITLTVIPIIDVAIADVRPSKTIVPSGMDVKVEVVAENQGRSTESFNVTAYFDAHAIGSQGVSNLTAGDSKTLTLTWKTTYVPKGNYTITASASVLPYETDTSDNTFVYGWVVITIAGDISGDFRVDHKDLLLLASAYGSEIGHPRYIPNADLNCDGKVDHKDLLILAANYGKTDP